MGKKLDLHRHNAPELYETAIDCVNLALDQDQSGRLSNVFEVDSRLGHELENIRREIHLSVEQSSSARLKSAKMYLKHLNAISLRAIVMIDEKLDRIT